MTVNVLIEIHNLSLSQIATKGMLTATRTWDFAQGCAQWTVKLTCPSLHSQWKEHQKAIPTNVDRSCRPGKYSSMRWGVSNQPV